METHHTDLKDSACVDYYVAGYWWSKEQSFTHEQMSAFFTVIHTVLQNIRGKSYGYYITIAETYSCTIKDEDNALIKP